MITRLIITFVYFIALYAASPNSLAQSCTSIAPESGMTSATSGTFRVYAYGVQNAAAVWFPTWGDAGGQDDLVWYPGAHIGGGTWFAEINLAAHKSGAPEYGDFQTHVYLSGTNYVGCGTTNWRRGFPTCSSAAPVSATTTAIAGTFRVRAFGVQDATAVHFPTWGSSGGQDDIIWYPGSHEGGGTWFADIDLGNHKSGGPEFGLFNTHVYAQFGAVTNGCASTSWSRQYSSVPPAVSLTSPSPSSVRPARDLGATLTLTSSASDDQGVSRVEYYANGTYVGQSSTPPYSVGFTPSTAGLYSISAKAVDLGGLETASQPGYSAFVRMVPMLTGTVPSQPIFLYNHSFPCTAYNEPAGCSEYAYPSNDFYMVVRHTHGPEPDRHPLNPVTVPLSWDFSRVYTGSNPCPFPLGGGYCALTNYTAPANQLNALYQVGHFNGNPNETSAFQQAGSNFGSFLNTFVSGCTANMPGNPGIHSAFEVRASPPIQVFDGHPHTEFVIEAELEIPALHIPAGSEAVAQVVLFAYFRSDANKILPIVLGVYDSRVPHVPGWGMGTDGSPFMGSSFELDNPVMSIRARNGIYDYGGVHLSTNALWTGKRLYRGFVSREKMQAVMNLMGYGGQTPEDFKLYNAGVLHEMYCPGTSEISSAYSGSNFRVSSARYY